MTKGLVFVNGVFDLLHPGHLHLLDEAFKLSPLGRLVVGINSDESVRRLKGSTRPIFNESSRLRMVEALWVVDEARIFDGDTPVKLIEELKPEMVVKGANYRGVAIPEGPMIESYGGPVKYVSIDPKYSTTKVIGAVRGGGTCL